MQFKYFLFLIFSFFLGFFFNPEETFFLKSSFKGVRVLMKKKMSKFFFFNIMKVQIWMRKKISRFGTNPKKKN